MRRTLLVRLWRGMDRPRALRSLPLSAVTVKKPPPPCEIFLVSPLICAGPAAFTPGAPLAGLSLDTFPVPLGDSQGANIAWLAALLVEAPTRKSAHPGSIPVVPAAEAPGHSAAPRPSVLHPTDRGLHRGAAAARPADAARSPQAPPALHPKLGAPAPLVEISPRTRPLEATSQPPGHANDFSTAKANAASAAVGSGAARRASNPAPNPASSGSAAENSAGSARASSPSEICGQTAEEEDLAALLEQEMGAEAAAAVQGPKQQRRRRRQQSAPAAPLGKQQRRRRRQPSTAPSSAEPESLAEEEEEEDLSRDEVIRRFKRSRRAPLLTEAEADLLRPPAVVFRAPTPTAAQPPVVPGGSLVSLVGLLDSELPTPPLPPPPTLPLPPLPSQRKPSQAADAGSTPEETAAMEAGARTFLSMQAMIRQRTCSSRRSR